MKLFSFWFLQGLVSLQAPERLAAILCPSNFCDFENYYIIYARCNPQYIVDLQFSFLHIFGSIFGDANANIWNF